MPNTAYCTAKFAIRGLTEALIEDLRSNALGRAGRPGDTGSRSGAWRILLGEDAKMIDERVRAQPETAYELFRDLTAAAAPSAGAGEA